jgi:hydrogenase maturation protease
MILVVGYGNTFCGDDGIGPFVAELLQEKELLGVQCISAHQLTPELAVPISLADIVLFVDAAYGTTPGEIICREPPPTVSSSLSHHVDPVTLLDSAYVLYGHRPISYLYSVTGKNFDLGQPFSVEVASALPRLLSEMKARIAECTNLALQKT